MSLTVLFGGLVALVIWVTVARLSSRGPLSWASPDCLFSAGLLIFYILPPLYWQFRAWNYWVPPYFEGLPLVVSSAALMGIPFLAIAIRRSRQTVAPYLRPPRSPYTDRLLVLIIPVILGILWTVKLVNIGWQGRQYHETPTFLGSESLAYLLGNISYYYPICYFALFGLGDSFQRRVGKYLWIFDGLFQIFLLHRYAMLIFIFRSGVFGLLLGWKPKFWNALLASVSILVIITIVGASDILSGQVAANSGVNHLSPVQVAEVLSDTAARYIQGDINNFGASDEGAPILRALDDTMFRLYDARSASAIMMNVPETIPYFYGSTYAHIFYALIPRFLWPSKPSLRDIHLVTVGVMPNDSGVNPTGTLAEFYMNFGFLGVFAGGIICVLITSWQTRRLTGSRITATAICTYPILAEQLFAANSNFTQRICEGFRFALIYFLMYVLLERFGRQKENLNCNSPKHTLTGNANAYS